MDDDKQENIPNIYDTLADLHRFMNGELSFCDGDMVQQVFVVRNILCFVTFRGVWRFEPEHKTIELVTMF